MTRGLHMTYIWFNIHNIHCVHTTLSYHQNTALVKRSIVSDVIHTSLLYPKKVPHAGGNDYPRHLNSHILENDHLTFFMRPKRSWQLRWRLSRWQRKQSVICYPETWKKCPTRYICQISLQSSHKGIQDTPIRQFVLFLGSATLICQSEPISLCYLYFCRPALRTVRVS